MAIASGQDIDPADFISSSAGAGDSGKVPKLAGDGKVDGSFLRIPIVRTYPPTFYGDSTSQFDITNPSGTTFRYTWDGTGTNPGINATTFPTGSLVWIGDTNFATANEGAFTITGSGTNYFEVTNASGVVESDKLLDTNQLSINKKTWTKPTGLTHIVVEVQAGGGGGSRVNVGGASGGGGGGGYSKKTIAAATLGATETVTIGYGGAKGSATGINAGTPGGVSSFGSHCSANGGINAGNDTADAGVGGTATGGDINIQGGTGGQGFNGSPDIGGNGGDAQLGRGGPNTNEASGNPGILYGGGGGGGESESGSVTGGNGAYGIVIVTEYY